MDSLLIKPSPKTSPMRDDIVSPMTYLELHALTPTLLLSGALAFGAVACGAQSPELAPASGSESPAEPVAEAAPVPQEPTPTYSIVVESSRTFIDATLPPPTDDSVWPPSELAVPVPDGVRPIRVSVRAARHTLEMETTLSADEVRAYYQTAFEAWGYALRELEGMPNEQRFGAERDGELTEITISTMPAGNDLLKIAYSGPRMPTAASGGDIATEDACRQAITAATEINLRRLFSDDLDSIPEAMREGIEADLDAEVALCTGHWRAPHLECYQRYANEPSMFAQCTEVARRDSGQAPLPV